MTEADRDKVPPDIPLQKVLQLLRQDVPVDTTARSPNLATNNLAQPSRA